MTPVPRGAGVFIVLVCCANGAGHELGFHPLFLSRHRSFHGRVRGRRERKALLPRLREYGMTENSRSVAWEWLFSEAAAKLFRTVKGRYSFPHRFEN